MTMCLVSDYLCVMVSIALMKVVLENRNLHVLYVAHPPVLVAVDSNRQDTGTLPCSVQDCIRAERSRSEDQGSARIRLEVIH